MRRTDQLGEPLTRQRSWLHPELMMSPRLPVRLTRSYWALYPQLPVFLSSEAALVNGNDDLISTKQKPDRMKPSLDDFLFPVATYQCLSNRCNVDKSAKD